MDLDKDIEYGRKYILAWHLYKIICTIVIIKLSPLYGNNPSEFIDFLIYFIASYYRKLSTDIKMKNWY